MTKKSVTFILFILILAQGVAKAVYYFDFQSADLTEMYEPEMYICVRVCVRVWGRARV